MDHRFRYNFWVGLFALVILAAVGVTIAFFLRRENPFRKTYHIFVRFEDVGGLKMGAPVKLSGAFVGNVRGISVAAPDRRWKKPGYRVKLEIGGEPYIQRWIRSDSVISIRSDSLFAEKFVNISFGRQGQMLTDGTEVDGIVAASIDSRTFQDLSLALKNVQQVTEELKEILGYGDATPTDRPNLKSALVNLDSTLKNTAQITEEFKRSIKGKDAADLRKTLQDVQEAAQNLKEVSERMKKSMNAWGESVEKMKFWKWFGNKKGRRPSRPDRTEE
jgi:phospholipid/cholesterol/gamma-HCH transport system substrate-binding protein